MSERISMVHALSRTNPIGETPFIGRCTQCGKENITFRQQQREDCPNPLEFTFDESLLAAIGKSNEPRDA